MSTVIDSYSESNASGVFPMDSLETVGLGQSFTGNGYKVTSAKFYIKKQAGSPTGNAYARLYAHSGTFGTSSIPTGAALAESLPFDVSTLTTSYALTEFTFDSTEQYIVADGSHYIITLEYNGGDWDNSIACAADTFAPVSHDGNLCYTFDGSSWYASSSYDDCFYVLGDEVSSNIRLLGILGVGN